MQLVLLTVGAYLLGAVPFGLLLGLARGVDIRRHGSRNIGATNAGRVLGKKWGHLCLALDIAKGLIPVLVARIVLFRDAPAIDAVLFLKWLAVALAAVAGHVFPVYLGFRGGKGVATTIGVAAGIFPYYALSLVLGLLTYAALRFATGAVSVGSLGLAIAFPVAFFVEMRIRGWGLAEHWPLLAAAGLLGVLIVARHHSNIRRLMRGEELRMPAAAPNAWTRRR